MTVKIRTFVNCITANNSFSFYILLLRLDNLIQAIICSYYHFNRKITKHG